MTSNYFTLARIVNELQPIIIGRRMLDAYSLRPNELRLRFEQDLTIVAVMRPIDGAVFFLTSSEKKPAKNVHSFYQEMLGAKVMWCEMSEIDRQFTIRLKRDDGYEADLTLSYFGQPNACLAHQDQLIECFKKRALEKFTNTIKPTSSVDERLGKKLMKEAEFRYHLYGQDIAVLATEIMVELREQHEASLYQKLEDFLISPIELKYLEAADWSRTEYPSTNEAVYAKIVASGRTQRLRSKRQSLLLGIKEQIERNEKQLSDMRKGFENSDRSERYANIANALQQAAASIEKGSQKVSVEVEGRMIDVKLDPEKTSFENAHVYFQRSKESRGRKQELIERSEELKRELMQLRELETEIESAVDMRALEHIEKRTKPQQQRLPKQQQTGPTFRKYIVFGGFTVLVGKNAKQNDELTTKFAKKEDVWLHARGVPGSHVVLQSVGAKHKVIPKEAIEMAAEIAAYYSEAKSQSIAPVSYTLKKFVRKPKGADPGAVFLEREEVIMVRPQIRGKEA